MPRSDCHKLAQARRQETLVTHASRWEAMFRQLEKYKKKHGHCNVPKSDKKNPRLSIWVNRQRQRYKGTKRNGIDRGQVLRLEALGFVWHPLSAQWEIMFGQLKAYKASHGHCNVLLGDDNNFRLAVWVYVQRRRYHNNKLTPARIQRLLEIGFNLFEPSVRSVLWEKRFLQLQAYKQAYGHCNVPAESGKHTQLGQWSAYQRQSFRNHSLAPDRFRRLEELGFQWKGSCTAQRWEQRFLQLQSFQKAHGHCRVPSSFDQTLCSWVATQRQKFKKNRLSQDLVGRLNALGFVWNAQRTNAGNALAKFRGFRQGRKSILSAAQIVRARLLLKEGKSVRAVAAAIKCHYSTIIRAQFASPPVQTPLIRTQLTAPIFRHPAPPDRHFTDKGKRSNAVGELAV